MSSEVKLTKHLIICVIFLLMIAVLINLNIERQFIVLDSPFVSNNLALTLAGGVITGITAVVIEKFYRYRMTRRFLQKFLWDRAVQLYGEIYHTRRNVEDLICNKVNIIQTQIFNNQMMKIKNLAFEIVSVDYHLFVKDNLMEVHENFRQSGYYSISNIDSILNNLDIAVLEFELAKNLYQALLLENQRYNLQRKIADTTFKEKYKFYYVLKIFKQELSSYLDLVEPYMKAIQLDDPENYDWDSLKNKTIIPCYTNLDKFLKENLVRKSTGD